MYMLRGQGLHRVAFPREDETPAIRRHLCHGTAGGVGLSHGELGQRRCPGAPQSRDRLSQP